MSTIFERDGRKILFIHIPKAGGTSMRHMLIEEGWNEIENPLIPDHMRTEILGDPRSNHQHKTLTGLWKKDWEYEFAIVRNPYERFFSQVKHIYKVMQNHFPDAQSTIDMFDKVYHINFPELGIGLDDNHFRPQHHFVDKDTEVFKFEDQAGSLMTTLVKKNIISSDRTFPHKNVTFKDSPSVIVHWPLVEDIHNKFLSFYQYDFENFEYSKEVPTYGLSVDWNRLKNNS
jgi:hypothetical protein